jgi:hypothetical protein
LLQQLGDAYAEVLADQRAMLRAAFAAWNGREIDTQGDAFFVVFTRANDALQAAVEAQRALAEHSWSLDAAVRVRMGLHTGEPWLGATGYTGMDVNRAARICAAGHGGQVLLSQTTRDLVEGSLPAGVTLRDLGEHRLKDLRQPRHLYQLILAGLPADFPPLKSLNFRLLLGGSRTALPRHQTLSALIDWSYDLLSEPERALLRRLSVFAGGWTLEAAEAVCVGERLEGANILDLLTQLVNKSLVVADREQGREARYHLLKTTREHHSRK